VDNIINSEYYGTSKLYELYKTWWMKRKFYELYILSLDKYMMNDGSRKEKQMISAKTQSQV